MSDALQLKILYIITSADRGGAQNHVLDLLRFFSRYYNCGVVIGEHGPLEYELLELGVKVWIIPNLVKPISPIRDIAAVLDLYKVIRSFGPQLIHCHSSKAGTVGRIAAKIAGIPSVFTAHGWAFTDGVSETRKRIALAIEKAMATISNAIICVSLYDHDLAIDRGVGVRCLCTVHNGISDSGIFCLRGAGSGSPLRLVMVARFSAQKDHKTLLEAIREIEEPFELLLIGDGELLEESRLHAAELGLQDNVKFLGARDDVPGILSECDAFILSSNYEGFPISILEAMRAGLPVIASDVGGIKEAVVHGVTGFLVPRGNVQELRNSIVRLMSDHQARKRMGNEGRQVFLGKFTDSVMLRKIEGVYRGVIQSS